MNSAVDTFKNLDVLPVSAAILDASGIIVAVNDTWKDFGRSNGLRIPKAGVGVNYLQYCPDSVFTAELRALIDRQLHLLTLVYPCHSPKEKRWFSLIGFPLSQSKPAGVALLHVNLTSMFPGQISGVAPVKAKDQAGVTTDVEAISAIIERSVSDTLSAQLDTMFKDARHDSTLEKTSAHPEAHGIIRSRLSERQVQVLRLLGTGKTNKEIAEILFRSPNTIKLHVSAILRQLKLKNRTEAALLASRLYKGGPTDLSSGDIKSWKNTHISL